MGPGEVLTMAIIFGSITLTAFSIGNFVYKTRREKYRAMGGSEEIKRELKKVLDDNKAIKKRLESLEAIVVDADLEELQTSFNSEVGTEIEELRKLNKGELGEEV
ncbi:MAG: hypothetical protein AAGC85_22760 [Bacteroidota bacterium]